MCFQIVPPELLLIDPIMHDRVTINTLRPRQNGHHFTDDIFKCIFFNENVWISLKISLKFVPNIWINHIPALVQIMAWCRPGDKPLSEPMMICLLKQICVTRPQWVNSIQAWISYYIDCKVWYVITYPFLNMSMLCQVLAFHWRLLGPPIGISALKMQIIERSTLLTVSVETRESIQTLSVLQKTFHMTCIVWVHIISSCRSTLHSILKNYAHYLLLVMFRCGFVSVNFTQMLVVCQTCTRIIAYMQQWYEASMSILDIYSYKSAKSHWYKQKQSKTYDVHSHEYTVL